MLLSDSSVFSTEQLLPRFDIRVTHSNVYQCWNQFLIQTKWSCCVKPHRKRFSFNAFFAACWCSLVFIIGIHVTLSVLYFQLSTVDSLENYSCDFELHTSKARSNGVHSFFLCFVLLCHAIMVVCGSSGIFVRKWALDLPFYLWLVNFACGAYFIVFFGLLSTHSCQSERRSLPPIILYLEIGNAIYYCLGLCVTGFYLAYLETPKKKLFCQPTSVLCSH